MSDDERPATVAEHEFWEHRAEAWERRADGLNQFSDLYGAGAIEALGAQPGERIVDVGCGPGTTAVQLAELVGPEGRVTALDIAESMAAAARRRAERSGATNVDVVVHDLELAPLDEVYDAVFSRFGVMFFPDPPAAFANLARSLRPGGRLSCVVWGPLEENPWMFVPTMGAAGVLGADLALPGPGEPGPFSLADPDVVRSLLGGTGFEQVEVARVDGDRVVPEAVADDEVRILLEVGPLGEAYEAADDATRRAAVQGVLDAIEPFRDGDGWRLAGSARVVTAVRPG